MRCMLIVNGRSAGAAGLAEAVAAARADGIQLHVHATEGPGDATRLAQAAIDDGVDVVVAGGGDGTLGIVAGVLAASSLPASSLPSLGVLPLGTANDFATAAALPMAPAEALALVASQPAVAVDMLRVEADDGIRWCINLASGGFGTEATDDAPEGLKQVLGRLAYLVAGLARLGRLVPVAARIRCDDLDHRDGFIALGIGNARLAGGGQPLCPDALVDDGLLDLTVIPELGGELLGALGTWAANGASIALDKVALRRRARAVDIESPQALTLHCDGEPVASRRFRIGCEHARLRVHLPPGCPLLGVPGNPLPLPAADDPGPEPALVAAPA